MSAIRIGVIGTGKIARDQHLPAIFADRRFVLAATVSPADPGVSGVPHYASLLELLGRGPALDAVVLCTPPQVRYGLATLAVQRGLHVFLEKPPGATLSELDALCRHAEACGVTLFAGWHSRHAAGVAEARSLLTVHQPLSAQITWREDVRRWHPGQAWIWSAGGLGVFDPGVNALSILTHIWPCPLLLGSATLAIPENRQAPIAAELRLQDVHGATIGVDFDWRQTGDQTWTITVQTADGPLVLSRGGADLLFQDVDRTRDDQEYSGLYDRFARLIGEAKSDVDVRPLQLVADAFLRGERRSTSAFVD